MKQTVYSDRLSETHSGAVCARTFISAGGKEADGMRLLFFLCLTRTWIVDKASSPTEDGRTWGL